MQRLNKNGFTLIELLAVIVVLGIVMVVTIPSIVSSVKAARQEAYEEALTIIEKYVNDEYTKCQIDPDSIEDYNSDIISNNGEECQLMDSGEISDIVLGITKYKNDINSLIFEYDDEDEEYVVKDAPINPNGNFKGVSTRSAFKPVDIDPGPGGGGLNPISPRPKF